MQTFFFRSGKKVRRGKAGDRSKFSIYLKNGDLSKCYDLTVKQYSIEEIIQGIRKRNNQVFKHLYKAVYPSARAWVRSMNGNEEDAKDIFQEALIVLYRNVSEPDFQLKSGIKTYIIGTCKILWFERYRIENEVPDDLPMVEEDFLEYGQSQENNTDYADLKEQMKLNLLQKYFKDLDLLCQRLLHMFYSGHSHKEISKRLKISNEYSRNQKRECLKKLMGHITSDPDYKKLYGFL
jgi:RNA polymerase sigma factor (sigma-70 family)